MTELNDETIDKIANAVRNKKISKIWQDPKKASQWGTAGWIIAIYAIVISVAVFWMLDITNYQSENNDDFRNVALNNMDCDSLKQTLLDLESDSEKANWDVEKQIIARCLN